MENRIKELEETVQLMVNKIASLEFKVLELQGLIKKPLKEKSPEGKSLGAMIFDAYAEAFKARHGHSPIRNAKVNKNCADIATRLGSDGIHVARFYVGLNDPQFTRMDHPIGVLLQNCESIHSMWKRGRMTTTLEAARRNRIENNSNASAAYLERKYGRK